MSSKTLSFAATLSRRFLQPRGRLLLVLSLASLSALALAVGFGLADTAADALESTPADGSARAESSAQSGASPRLATYTVSTHGQSYFHRDERGVLTERDGLPYRDEGVYRYRRTIDPAITAVVVMDPWIDMASEHLNEYYGKIATARVVPLVNTALGRGHRVIVLTNDPRTVKYNTRIHPDLAALVESGKATLLYHEDLDDDQFAERLRADGISTLIYTGFASNMCVIGRRMGMIPMVQQGFKTYFVPEASAAVETEGNWETGAVHRATTSLISQWIAEILHYDDFMQAKPAE